MITTLLRKNQTIKRTILLLTITGISTLALCLGSIALPLLSFSPFSFAHAATTCASTKGTQPALCEDQDPMIQGCAQDAHSIEMQSVFTTHNELIGEADVRSSAICKTHWIRTVLYAHVQNVQAIDAVTTSHTGKTEDRKKTISSTKQPITVTTPMLFTASRTVISIPKSLFFLKGQAQPITIPLSPFTQEGATTTKQTATQLLPPMTCVSHPTGPDCNHQDPIAQGCSKDAQTVSFREILNKQDMLLATLQMRYSALCYSEWGRMVEAPQDHQPMSVSIGTDVLLETTGPIVFTMMVFVPNRSITPGIAGVVSTNGLSSNQNGSQGIADLLPALPASQK